MMRTCGGATLRTESPPAIEHGIELFRIVGGEQRRQRPQWRRAKEAEPPPSVGVPLNDTDAQHAEGTRASWRQDQTGWVVR